MTTQLLWLDLETTGLSPDEDKILEVAWKFTNLKLSSHGALQSEVVFPNFVVLYMIMNDQLLPVVKAMHTESGLIDDILDNNVPKFPLTNIESAIIERMDEIAEEDPEGTDFSLAGASVHFDRSFIDVHMPRLSKRLSHRILDTSSLKLLARGADYEVDSPANVTPHRAGADVIEVLEYARTFREALVEYVGERV